MNPRIYYPKDYKAVHGDKPFNSVVCPGLSLWIQKEMLAHAITQRHVSYAIGALYHVANGGADKKRALQSFMKDGVCLKDVDLAALNELIKVLEETARMELQAEPDKESLANEIIFALRCNYFLNTNYQPVGPGSGTQTVTDNVGSNLDSLSEAVSQGFNAISTGTGKILSYFRYISPFECSRVNTDHFTEIELESFSGTVTNSALREDESHEMQEMQEISDRPTTYGSFGNLAQRK